MINGKQLGGILLITGNAMGGGMLALPLATAQLGFINSSLFLIACWALMLTGSLLLLEVNLGLPEQSHFVSMARTTLGRTGAMLTWLCYLLLLLSLLSAYTAGGADFLQSSLQTIHFPISLNASAVLFVLSFGLIVYQGIRSVDHLNRMLMGGKLLIYALLIILLLPYLSTTQLHRASFDPFPASLTIMVTSFGFAAIIPSLRSYFHSDVVQLRRIIVIGSLIPLICYLLWIAAVMGILPFEGPGSLEHIVHTQRSTSELSHQLSQKLHVTLISGFIWSFTSICLLTSFLGVGLSLYDFLRDGLNLKNTFSGKTIAALLTFLPPLFIVFFFPHTFMRALNYAGVCCVILLALLPAFMTWSARYRKKFAASYQVRGGKLLLSVVMIATSIIIIRSVMTFLGK
jgi:tyrosine-specific transport protein